ncbi:MAG TPA: proline--tRNA ligase [Myxococcota bacterium]|nr:proline--tRNA ligase [Myxococcota bacterium]
MRWSQMFIPTLRDDPADAEATSHRLMLRAGLIRQLGAGIYSKLPLAERVARRVEAIVREEMARIGAQEFRLPMLHPAEPWKESGRWSSVKEELFRLKDRKQGDMALALTAEEIFTTIARDELRSYRQLPQIWYQIGDKFRDEPRPKSGVLRGREFTMKDSYSFDVDAAGLDVSFEKHADAYRRIFSRCGIETIPVEASSGAMGGSQSVEFMAVCDAGEDWIVVCPGCGYAANLEKAKSVAPPVSDPPTAGTVEKFPTPGVRTIEDLTRFQGGAAAERQIKTLVYVVAEEPVLLLLRGDHELNEVKLAELFPGKPTRPAHPEECRAALGALPGSLGAVGVTRLRVFADEALRGRREMTTGANENDFHLRHVDVARDLAQASWADLRNARAGDACVNCNKSLELKKTIEMGHIFKLGLYYTEPMGARVLTAEGKEVPIVMGSYGIGIERIMAAAIEAHHDQNGIVWPISIAPFHVVVATVKASDPEQREKSERLYAELGAAGLDVLLDDRDERPGVKFKDADLIGIPFRVVLGPRALAKGCVELVVRAGGQTLELPLEQVTAELGRRIQK